MAQGACRRNSGNSRNEEIGISRVYRCGHNIFCLSALIHDSRRENVQALKDEVRLMGWDNLLEDIEWATRLAGGGTLATRGAGGEMTSCFALGLYEVPFVLGIILLAIELDAELLVRLSGIVATGGARLRPATIHG
jgi:hypothetical protein